MARRNKVLSINDFLPQELEEFNGPNFNYDESAFWDRGRILVVYKIAGTPTTTYTEDRNGFRVTADCAFELENDE